MAFLAPVAVQEDCNDHAGDAAPTGASGWEPQLKVSSVGIRSSKERLRLKLYTALLAVDLASVFTGFLLANWIRFGSPLEGPGVGIALGCAPVFAALAFSGRSYSLEALEAPARGVFKALRALGMTAFALLAVLFSAKQAEDISRIVFALGTVSAATLMTLGRYGLCTTVGRRNNWNLVNEVILVDGVPAFPTRGQIVLYADELELSPSINDPESFDRMGRLLANCDRVILATHPSRRAAWAGVLKCAGIAVELLTPELDSLGPLQLRQFGGRAAVLVATGPLGLRDRLLKRALDLLVALPALVLLSPLICGVAALIKLTSRGPVFFRQERVGGANRIFAVLKFRTMHADAADIEGARSASRNDERITALGRLLRRTSIDELPQLINVILGDMSLVGPRPHALGSTAGESLFWHADARYWERGMVKPGITGLAQIRGYRGATHTREDLVNRVQADLDYLSGWSIWRDVSILLRTVKVVAHQNAY